MSGVRERMMASRSRAGLSVAGNPVVAGLAVSRFIAGDAHDTRKGREIQGKKSADGGQGVTPAAQGRAQHLGDLRAPVRVPGGQDQHGVGGCGADGIGDQRLFARVCAGGQHYLATGQRLAQPVQFFRVVGQRFADQFQIEPPAGRGPKLTQSPLCALVLRQDQVERRQHCARRLRPAGPAVGAGRRHPGREQRQTYASAFRFQDQVWPQLALDKHRQPRSPVVEEPADGGRCIHGNVLMDHAGRQACGQKFGGCA